MSIIDLGMVENITIDNETVNVEILPTFVGCPALDIIQINMVKAINQLDGRGGDNGEFYQLTSMDFRSNHGKRNAWTEGIRDCPSAQTYERRRFLACGLSVLRFYVCHDGKYFWSDSMSKHSLL